MRTVNVIIGANAVYATFNNSIVRKVEYVEDGTQDAMFNAIYACRVTAYSYACQHGTLCAEIETLKTEKLTDEIIFALLDGKYKHIL